MVSFELFVSPALLRLMGYRKTTRPLYQAIIDEDVANAGRTGLRGAGAGLAGGRRLARQLHRARRGRGSCARWWAPTDWPSYPGGTRGVRAGEEVEFLLLREDLEEP